VNDPDLPHLLPVSDPEDAATETIERLHIVDPYHIKFVRINEHMHVVFNFNRSSEERVASLQAIRDILNEEG